MADASPVVVIPPFGAASPEREEAVVGPADGLAVGDEGALPPPARPPSSGAAPPSTTSTSSAAATPRTLRRLPSDPALAARVAAIPDADLAALKEAALALGPGLFTQADLAAAADADGSAAAGTRPADPSAAGSALLSAASLNRFLRAAGSGGVTGAAARLVATARWRAGRAPGGPCPLCVDAPGSHYMQIVGRDALARPVIYSALALARDRGDVASNVAHMTSVFESAAALMTAAPSLDGPGGPLAEQWTWVSDFTGFGLRDCDPRIGRAFLSLAADHYPERLRRFVLVGTPPIFNSLWRLLARHVCADTRAKVVFLPYDPAPGGPLDAGLAACDIEPPLRTWLLTEMAQNRRPGVAASGKAYPYGSVLNPGACEAARWEVDGHDVRGEAGVLRVLAACPGAPVVSGGRRAA